MWSWKVLQENYSWIKATHPAAGSQTAPFETPPRSFHSLSIHEDFFLPFDVASLSSRVSLSRWPGSILQAGLCLMYLPDQRVWQESGPPMLPALLPDFKPALFRKRFRANCG